MAVNLLDFDGPALIRWFDGLGEKPFRARQVLRWIHRFGQTDFDAMTDVARSLREKLAGLAEVRLPDMAGDRLSDDGTRKFLFDVGGGNAVETVFIPEDDRGTLCISTQAGCALECAFCSTGRQGFNRNLTAAEIIGQLLQANRLLGRDPAGERVVSNVVLMGMGEPLANFDNVVTALRLMLDDNAHGLSRRRVTVSTSGLVPAMDRLREACPVALAVSLHAPTDELRDRLVPINRKYPLRELMQACRDYPGLSNARRITFEYVMLKGVNDSLADAKALVKLLSGIPAKINLIPFNPWPGSAYECSDWEQIERFADFVNTAGYASPVRTPRGRDILAACGQLRSESQKLRASERSLAIQGGGE